MTSSNAPRWEALRHTGLFNGLTDDEFEKLNESVHEWKLSAGSPVFSEGDRADGMYIILEGVVQVLARARDGQEVVLAKLEAGDYFGEQALLPSSPSYRNASVRVHTDATLLRVRKEEFQKALSKDSPLKGRVLRVGEKQLRENLIKQSQLFRSLDVGSEGDDWHVEEQFPDGHLVFREGDAPDRFYLITSGTAGVYKDEDGAQKLLVRLREGQCFGELALLQQQPRAATVAAEGPLQVLSIAGDHFLRLYHRTPELREYMKTLERVYVLPGRGFTTQHSGEFLGHECISTMYHLADGMCALASRVIGQDIYGMNVIDSEPQETTTLLYLHPSEGIERELTVRADGTVVGLTSRGPWQELGELHRMVLDREPLARWQRNVFQQLGSLHLEDPAVFNEDSEVICPCMQVSRGTIRQAILRGCTTAGDVRDRTGAGSVCGSCVPGLNAMLGHEEWTPAIVIEVIEVAEEIRSFRLRPVDGDVKPFRPGQHIVVQAQVDGNWLQRSYTLTSTPSDPYYEITVKREPHGAFSAWLFEQRRDEDLIRISSPQGDYFLDEKKGLSVCLVGGIGMTPALAMCRAIARGNTGQRLHIEYCASTPEQLVYAEELEEAARNHENITVAVRITGQQGRATPGDISGVLERHGDATYYLCGPAGFQSGVRETLSECGVDADRLRVEAFTPAGDLPTETAEAPETPATAATPAEHADLEIPPIDATQDASVSDQARAFLYQLYHEKGIPSSFESRWTEVSAEIDAHGSYEQTYDELAYGAKLAWRNSTRCIGRPFWQGLQLRDKRHLEGEQEIFEAIVEHIRLATNGGNLRAVMTVFAPRAPGKEGIRIWNPQLLHYAGYRLPDGSVIGDPKNSELTDAALALGWSGGERTPFDLLPIIIQKPGCEPKLFELPREHVLEVPIVHPQIPAFVELGLKWYALPAISDMLLDVGGVQYTAAPFNGWYMGAEIGARNLTDEKRYNLIPELAEKLGLDTSSDRTLWRDQVLLELNRVVLHSYEKRGVKIVDHHACSRDFMEFAESEQSAGRPVYGDRSRLVPPMSGGITPVFHAPWQDRILKPSYFHQPKAWSESE